MGGSCYTKICITPNVYLSYNAVKFVINILNETWSYVCRTFFKSSLLCTVIDFLDLLASGPRFPRAACSRDCFA